VARNAFGPTLNEINAALPSILELSAAVLERKGSGSGSPSSMLHSLRSWYSASCMPAQLRRGGESTRCADNHTGLRALQARTFARCCHLSAEAVLALSNPFSCSHRSAHSSFFACKVSMHEGPNCCQKQDLCMVGTMSYRMLKCVLMLAFSMAQC